VLSCCFLWFLRICQPSAVRAPSYGTWNMNISATVSNQRLGSWKLTARAHPQTGGGAQTCTSCPFGGFEPFSWSNSQLKTWNDPFPKKQNIWWTTVLSGQWLKKMWGSVSSSSVPAPGSWFPTLPASWNLDPFMIAALAMRELHSVGCDSTQASDFFELLDWEGNLLETSLPYELGLSICSCCVAHGSSRWVFNCVLVRVLAESKKVL
jgi:hypothetical protein